MLERRGPLALSEQSSVWSVPRRTCHVADRWSRVVNPESPPLERVRWQADLPASVPLVERNPVDGRAAHVELRQTVEHRFPICTRWLQTGQPRVRASIQDRSGDSNQCRLRSDLEEGVDPEPGQRAQPVGKAYRLTNVRGPVRRVGNLRSGQTPGDVRDQCLARFAKSDRVGHATEVGEDGIHQRRVEGVRHPQRTRTHSASVERAHDGFEGCP